MHNTNRRHPFLPDGYQRAVRGADVDIAWIRWRVQARFQRQLDLAGPVERIRLRTAIRKLTHRRIRRYLDRVAPPEACYLVSTT